MLTGRRRYTKFNRERRIAPKEVKSKFSQRFNEGAVMSIDPAVRIAVGYLLEVDNPPTSIGIGPKTRSQATVPSNWPPDPDTRRQPQSAERAISFSFRSSALSPCSSRLSRTSGQSRNYRGPHPDHHNRGRRRRTRSHNHPTLHSIQARTSIQLAPCSPNNRWCHGSDSRRSRQASRR